MNIDGNEYRGWSAIPGTSFGYSKINSNKVFRAFCLIVWILLWSYLVQGVQKAVQNRILTGTLVVQWNSGNQSLGREIRIKLVPRGKSKLFVQPTLPGRKHTVSFSWLCISPVCWTNLFLAGRPEPFENRMGQKCNAVLWEVCPDAS